MSSDFVAGQAVVTDPGGASAGGYVLVAASPAVSAEEGSFLEHSPGISEHLHRATNPGPYFSFFQLPSGRLALVRRFVGGERRGLNRVVVHLLVLSETLLRHLEGDAWLLASACRYRLPGGPLQSLADLGRQAAAAGLQRLDDLECLPPEAPRQASLKAIAERRGFLAGRWGEERLRQTLAWLFDALSAGKRALLPQDLEHEQLLALAVAALPLADRLQVPWTTHFAPGVPVAFRLANAPDMEEARQLHRNLDEWRLLPPQARTLDRPGIQSGAIGLAQVVAAGEQHLAALLFGPGGGAPSLLRDADALGRYVSWHARDAQLVRAGYPDLPSLGSFLKQARAGWQRDPWLKHAGLVLYATVRTGCRLLAHGQSFDAVAIALGTELAQTQWTPLVLTAAQLAELQRQPPFEPLSADELLLAVALVRAALPAAPAAPREREELLQHFRNPALVELVAAPPPGAVAELRRLALDLGRCRSARCLEALGWLAGIPAGLEAAIPELSTSVIDLPAAIALLGELLKHQRHEAAGRLMAEKVVPILVYSPDSVRELPAELLKQALATLQKHPAGLAEALRAGRGALLDGALEQLKRWAVSDTAAAAAQHVVAELTEEVAGEPAQPLSDALLASDQLSGVTFALLKAHPPAGSWLPFAFAEAAARDSRQLAASSFHDALRLPEVSPEEASLITHQVLAGLQRAATGKVGENRRALFQLALPGMAQHPQEAMAAITQLLQAEGVHPAAWHEEIQHAVAALAAARAPKHAEQLRLNWLRQLLLAGETDLPPGAERLLAEFSPKGRSLALEAAKPYLGKQLGPNLLRALRRLAEGAEPELRLTFEAAILANGLDRPGGLEIALEHLDAIAAPLDAQVRGRAGELPSVTALRPPVHSLLRELEPPERARQVIELLLSPQVSQTVKLLLERGLLASSLKEAGKELELPGFTRLTARGNLLLAAAMHVGQHWDQHTELTTDFLSDALSQQRLDAVQVLLDAAVPGNRQGDDLFLRHLAETQPRGLPQRLLRLMDERAEAAGRLERHTQRLYVLMSRA